MIVYIERDGSGAIKGVYHVSQPGYAEEVADDQAAEVVTFLASLNPARDITYFRGAAANCMGTSLNGLGVIGRAVILTALDEINILRARLRAQDAAVAAATTLADLKTRWAAAAAAITLPDRTPLQAKTSVTAKINAGGAD